MGKYLWSEDEHTVYSHLWIGSEAVTRFGRIRLEGEYPWQGRVCYTVADAGSFTLAVHIPGHVTACILRVNNQEEAYQLLNGYAYIRRNWQAGDTVSLIFDMPVRRLHADIRVRSCAGKIALARGPLIYCFEEADQEQPLSSISLSPEAKIDPVPSFSGLPEEIVCLSMDGNADMSPDVQYSPDRPGSIPCQLKAIPYYAWANRSPGNMLVWIRER